MRTLVQVLVLTAAAMAPAFGDVVFNLNYEFSGAQSPQGPAPWLTATFSDVSTGIVQLEMSTAGLINQEFVSEWFFNLNTSYNPSNLVITHVSSDVTAETVLKSASQSTNTNKLKADGDGYFDFGFEFYTSGVNKFVAGKTSIYTISGIPNLKETDFLFVSAPGGGNGSWHSAAHVQGIGATGGGSGWIGPTTAAVSEPSPYLAYGLALGGLGWVMWRRRLA
jgi:hypothetical protein